MTPTPTPGVFPTGIPIRDEKVTTHRLQQSCTAVAIAASETTDACVAWVRANDPDALGQGVYGAWCALAPQGPTPPANPLIATTIVSRTPEETCVHVENPAAGPQGGTVCCYGYRWGNSS